MSFAPHVSPYMAGQPTASSSTSYGSYANNNPPLYSAPSTPGPSSAAATAGASHQAQPITRSRTLFYLSVRDSSSTGGSYSRNRRRSAARGLGGSRQDYGDTIDVADEEERVGLMGDGIGGRSADGGLPPKWVDVSDEVEEILGRIKPKIAALDKLHAKHVLPGFTDRTAEEREIERQTADITRDFRQCTTLISSIQPGPRAQRVEIMTAKNVQRGMAQKVQELSATFRKKQKVYMQKLQGHAIKNKDLLAASGAISVRGPESFDELADDEQVSKSQLQSQSQVAVDLDLDTRTKEITQIASSISELADLFRDLSNLIVEQGTVLDSVEYNVQVTARELSGAVEELKVAQRYQANTGRRKCMLLLILIIVALILILIYKPRTGGSEAPAQPDDNGHTWQPKPPPLEDLPVPIGDDEERRRYRPRVT